jgi:hypothetical protein
MAAENWYSRARAVQSIVTVGEYGELLVVGIVGLFCAGLLFWPL